VTSKAPLALALATGTLALVPAAAPAVPPPQTLPLSSAPKLAASAAGARGRIVRAAVSQLGYRDRGHFCSRFGPCEPWCALFSTWAWQRAGVPVARYPFTGTIYDWAVLNTHVLAPAATPRPGDVVLFGTGPRTVGTSLHVGIVEDVYPGYIVTVEGDSDHRVVRLVVPTGDPTRVGEPGRIYAYASPLRDAPAVPLAGARRAAAARALRSSKLVEPALRASRLTPTDLRLRKTLRSLRAFQHMPYRTAGVTIGWTGVDSLGEVNVAVISNGPLASAQAAWQSFLGRWGDPGVAYAVSYYTAG